MRRPVALAASMAAAAAFSYFVGPDVLEYIAASRTEKLKPTSSSVAVAATTADGRAAAVPAPAAVPERPHASAHPVASKAEHRPRETPGPRAPLRRKPRPDATAPSQRDVTGLEPASETPDMRPSAVVASADPARAPKAQRNLGNPRDNRWIDDLSGQRAKISMDKSRAEGECADCERPEAPKDISVAGVVVKTKNLGSPGSPLDGRIKQGHFKDHTPAVYVE